MKRKTVLFLVQLPPPVNGASVMNQALVGSQMLVDCCDPVVLSIRMNRVHRRLMKFSFGKVWRSAVLLLKLQKALLRHKPAAVYLTFSPFGYAFYRDLVYVFLIKLFRKKLILHIHGKGISDLVAKHPLLRFPYRYVFRGGYVVSLSELLATDIKPVFDGRPFIVNNGIPDHALLPKLYQDGSSQPVRFLYLSNLCRTKGVYDYLAALKRVKERGGQFAGWVVGAEADISHKDLEKEIKRLGLGESVVYLGPLYDQEKWEILRRADIFVFPTFYRNEAFPVSILEAMQFSLPVITTPEGAISDIVDEGVTGFIVEQNDPVSLSEKMEMLIENETLRREMGLAGRKKYEEKYQIETFEDRMRTVIETVLKDESS